jgi:nucleotide-binding universal stress UspA family protein
MQMPEIKRIFHPSDFSEAGSVAFVHALKLALCNQGWLTILHTGDKAEGNWAEFPRIRATLERWELLPPNSGKEALHELGLQVEKVFSPMPDPVRGVAKYLGRHPQDLIVLMTHQHDGFERLLHKATAEPIARLADEMTLFMPHGFDGFVAYESGAANLHNVLIPVAQTPHAQAAIAGAAALTASLACHTTTFTLLYIGEESVFPHCTELHYGAWQWRRVARPGNVKQQILATAHECRADLIAMTTMGHQGFLDALRGSTTERIVRNSMCPVLAVPAAPAQTQTMPSHVGLSWLVGT